MKRTLTLATVLVAMAAVPLAEAQLAKHARSAPGTRTKSEVELLLQQQKISLDIHEATLSDVIDLVREMTSLQILLSPSAIKQAGDHTLTMRLSDVPVQTALGFILSQYDLTTTYEQGILMIVPRKEWEARSHLEVYDVKDVLTRIPDFPGPSIELSAAEGSPGVIVAPEEPEKPLTSEDQLLDIIQKATGPARWDPAQFPNASLRLHNGLLFVTHNRSMHREVLELILRLRQFK